MSHDHHVESDLSFNQKLEKLLHHWIKHNDAHAETYREWMKKAGEEELDDIADLMKGAADLTAQITEKFEQALRSISGVIHP